MDLAKLDSWFPGEINKRSLYLEWLADEFQRYLPDVYKVMPVSYHDKECMWLTVKLNEHTQTIPCECVREIIDGLTTIDPWFDVGE